MDHIRLSSGELVSVTRTRPVEDSSGPSRVLIDRVNNVWGSTAGAGSDFFHAYRKHRATEMERLRKMDEDYEEEQEALEFQRRREELLKLNQKREEKAAKRRQKAKERREKNKKLSKQGNSTNRFGSHKDDELLHFAGPVDTQPATSEGEGASEGAAVACGGDALLRPRETVEASPACTSRRLLVMPIRIVEVDDEA